MIWDYGEDRVRSVATRMQDDGYGDFAKYFDVYMFTDTVVIKYFSHNGGYPSSVHRVPRKRIVKYLEKTIFEQFAVPYGFLLMSERLFWTLCKLQGVQSP